MSTSFQAKRALVCGASSGIGRAVAFELAASGHQITALARRSEPLATLVQSLPGEGHRFVTADLADRSGLESAIRAQLAHGPFQTLILNSGGPAPGPITQAKEDDLVAALGPHVLAAMTLTRLLLPGMKESGWGRIVAIVSTSVKAPLAGLGVSNTVRGAMGNWAKTLAGEVAADAITVNCVLPGATATERLETIITNKARASGQTPDTVTEAMQHEIPMRRFGRPEEIAALIGFLASDKASYLTGTAIAIDGGRTPCF